MEYQRRNLNRGYQQLRVWSNAISLVDSVHRSTIYDASSSMPLQDSITPVLQHSNISLHQYSKDASL